MSYFWRFSSPSTLLFALLLFSMPWVELQCTETRKTTVPGTSVVVPSWVLGPLGEKRTVFVTQSGRQAAFGQWSPAKPAEFWESANAAQDASKLDAAMPDAPALLLYPALLALGVIAGIGLPLGGWRRIATAAAALGALATAGWHYQQEFPLKHAYRQIATAEAELRKSDPSPTAAEIEEQVRSFVRCTSWFWLAQAALLGTLGILVLEWTALRCHPLALSQSAPTAEKLVEV